jgi:hypothetical protein
MARKQVVVTDFNRFVKIGGLNDDGTPRETKFAGYLMGYEKRAGKYLSEDGTPKTQNLYRFQTPEGEVGMYGSTDLDKQLTTIPPGSMVWIEYKGKKPTKSGRKMDSYLVEFDDDNRVPLENNVVNTDDSEDTDYNLDNGTNHGNVQQGQLSAAARKAALDAKLAAKRNK